MPKPRVTAVRQLATRQDDGVATVYVYGIIGQMPEWWLPKEDQTVEEISAMALISVLNELSQTNDVIKVRINSPGGSVFEGEAMVNAMRDCSATIHTYNDGIAASMAATIWLAGDERHMASNAKLMLHVPTATAYGRASDLRETADMLDAMTAASAAGIAELTGMDEEEVTAKFFDGADHWLTRKAVDELGLISVNDTYKAAKVPTDVEQLSTLQLFQQFQATPPQERKPSAMQRIRKLAGVSQQTPITPENPEPVTPQELRDAIANGDITVEQLGEIHQELSTPPQSAEQVLQETVQLAVTGAVQEAMAERDATIAELREQVQQLGNAPGDQPAGLGAAGDPGTNKPSAVQQDADMFDSWAKKGFSPFRNPLTQVPE